MGSVARSPQRVNRIIRACHAAPNLTVPHIGELGLAARHQPDYRGTGDCRRGKAVARSFHRRRQAGGTARRAMGPRVAGSGRLPGGRSDIDLVALTATTLTDPHLRDLQRVHEALQDEMPLADKLHCSYMARSELADASRDHVTWAHGELYDRIVSPVTRRELTRGGLSLLGPLLAAVVPAVTDQELADYIRGDLRDYWYPKTARPALWLGDIWVDLGLLTLARATVTLHEGRLITRKEALEVLADRGAPADVLHDIYQRRYETPQPISEEWRARRGLLARTYVRAGIEEVLALPGRPRPKPARPAPAC